MGEIDRRCEIGSSMKIGQRLSSTTCCVKGVAAVGPTRAFSRFKVWYNWGTELPSIVKRDQ